MSAIPNRNGLRFLSSERSADASIEETYGERLALLALLGRIGVPSFLVLFAWLDLWALFAALAPCSVCLVAAPLIYRCTGSIVLARESFLVSLFVFKMYETAYFGTILSPGSLWIITLPVIPIMVGSVASGVAWTLITIAAIIAFLVLDPFPVGSPRLGFEEMQLIYGFNAVYVVVCLSLFVIFVDRERRTAMAGLARMNEKVRELAISDPLTGLFNRRHLGDLMASDDARPSDERTIQAVLVIDIDHFKSINDRFGHLVGDRVLKSVAEVIGAQAGADNPVGRFGGEEFVCLVRRAPGAGERDEARVLSEAIRRRVAALAFPDIAKLGAVTVSIGYADCAGFGGAQAALPEADFALYAAKNAGRDRTQDARARCVA